MQTKRSATFLKQLSCHFLKEDHLSPMEHSGNEQVNIFGFHSWANLMRTGLGRERFSSQFCTPCANPSAHMNVYFKAKPSTQQPHPHLSCWSLRAREGREAHHLVWTIEPLCSFQPRVCLEAHSQPSHQSGSSLTLTPYIFARPFAPSAMQMPV